MTSAANRKPGLIITADDFGLHASVNLAVERAHREGVLSAASLMVAAPAAADAIERARANPSLRVGLHLVLADGRALLPPDAIPDLVDAHGRFGDRMAYEGARFFFLPRVRRQLAAEIHAQFKAFAASGLALDHVNTHKHFHLHPTILSLMIDIGRPFGLRAIRLPRENGLPLLLKPWLALLRRKLDAAGIAHNDTMAGIQHSGKFDEAALLETLAHLPGKGVVEIYLHPALISGAEIGASMATYRHADEFAALISPRVRLALDRLGQRGFRLGGFSDLVSLK
ncbi:MAG: putative phosphatase/phosphotransferase [Herminiimonas sp.]|nr:putative phosphatase/phosphotransferase [Herminiimonas sp.]